jgi:hypothetical protein
MDMIAEQGMPLKGGEASSVESLQSTTIGHKTEGEADEWRVRGAEAVVDGAYVHRDLGVIFVVIGVIFAMLGAASFWQVLAILLIGGPLAALFASWPIALGQALRALADVAEYVRDQQQGVPAQRLSEGEQAPRD